jgi:lipid-A-disaccharide synthase
MKYYIIAGEASGDLHGSNLIREIRKNDPSAAIRCWGGDKMQAQGAELVKHYRELAFMGFVEVLMNLRTIFRNLAFCRNDISAFQPDVLILVDYPGFNLRIAKWAKEQGFRVVYYIAPQVWAWKENRVKSMKQCIDLMLVILPFEKEYFRNKWNWEVHYVGHPLVEETDTAIAKPVTDKLAEKPVVALLPGSRKQEISKKLPVMLEMSRRFPAFQFIVAKAPGTEESFYKEMLAEYPGVTYVQHRTYELLLQSKAALVTSGTATLETALLGVPEVVCYKGSAISYQIAKRVIRVKYISLVNLIMDREIVKELIQDALNTENLEAELKAILEDENRIATMKKEYAELRHLLQKGGIASAAAAAHIHQFLNGAVISRPG